MGQISALGSDAYGDHQGILEETARDPQAEGGQMTHVIRFIRRLLPVIVILLSIQTLSVDGLYKCTRVIDGDTIKVTSNGYQSTIRLVGIDAPEKSRKKNGPGQPFSQKATKYLAKFVLNNMVRIESHGQDRYFRVLGVVYVTLPM